jgi:hypothetical protein
VPRKPYEEETQLMEKIIGDYLEHLKVGRKQSHKNLALYHPLWSLCSL